MTEVNVPEPDSTAMAKHRYRTGHAPAHLLLLHGVAYEDCGPDLRPEVTWPSYIRRGLDKVPGVTGDFASVPLRAPWYRDILAAPRRTETSHKIILRPASKPIPPERRRTERARLEGLLGEHDFGQHMWTYLDTVAFTGAQTVDKSVFSRQWLAQIRNYAEHASVRERVRDRILAQLPDAGELVMVGHSLGSMITADLIPWLPRGVSVRRVITIGSPAAHPMFKHLYGPWHGWLETSVEAWINFWGDGDPACCHAGISDRIPGVLDLRIKSPYGLRSHAATSYLTERKVALALADALRLTSVHTASSRG